MGNIFFKLNKTEVADSLYRQVTSMWYQYLKDECTKRTDISELDSILGKSDETEIDKESLGKQKYVERRFLNFVSNELSKSVNKNKESANGEGIEKITHLEVIKILINSNSYIIHDSNQDNNS